MGAKKKYDLNQFLLDVYGDKIESGDPKQKHLKLGAACVRALMGGGREPKDHTQLIKRQVLAGRLVNHDEDSDDDYKVMELEKRQRNLLKDAIHETFGSSPLIYCPAIEALGFEVVDQDDEDDDEPEQAEQEGDETAGDE